jgi:CDP-L-myo-inositol myo-inositolphosphotransferase
VSHLGRALIAADRDGIQQAVVLLADAPALKAQIAEELARAGASIEVEWSPPEVAAPAGTIGLGDPRALERQVLLATGKSSDGIVSRYLNRPVSRAITARVLLIPGARPWHLTFVTAVIAIFMFAALLTGKAWGVMLGGFLFHLASVLDGVDGEMARATYRSNLLFFLGITIGLSRLHGGHYAMVGGLAFSFYIAGVALLAFLVRLSGRGPSFDLLKVTYGQRFPSGWMAHVVTFVRLTTSRDFFAFVLGLLAVTGATAAIPWLILLAASCWLLFIIAAAPTLIAAPAPSGAPAPASQP